MLFGADGTHYIALEFLSGQTLHAVFEALQLNPQLVARSRHQLIASRIVASLAQETPMLINLPTGPRTVTLVRTNGEPSRDMVVEVTANRTVMLNAAFAASLAPPAPPPAPAPTATP